LYLLEKDFNFSTEYSQHEGHSERSVALRHEAHFICL
jgi:hypothetical protein